MLKLKIAELFETQNKKRGLGGIDTDRTYRMQVTQRKIVTYLTRLCKWMADSGVGRIGKTSNTAKCCKG